jgi:hypothetical protein
LYSYSSSALLFKVTPVALHPGYGFPGSVTSCKVLPFRFAFQAAEVLSSVRGLYRVRIASRAFWHFDSFGTVKNAFGVFAAAGAGVSAQGLVQRDRVDLAAKGTGMGSGPDLRHFCPGVRVRIFSWHRYIPPAFLFV